MAEPERVRFSMDEWSRLLDKSLPKLNIEQIMDSNALLDEMLKYIGPLTPEPWHRRWMRRLGDRLISLGIRLGGDYDY